MASQKSEENLKNGEDVAKKKKRNKFRNRKSSKEFEGTSGWVSDPDSKCSSKFIHKFSKLSASEFLKKIKNNSEKGEEGKEFLKKVKKSHYEQFLQELNCSAIKATKNGSSSSLPGSTKVKDMSSDKSSKESNESTPKKHKARRSKRGSSKKGVQELPETKVQLEIKNKTVKSHQKSREFKSSTSECNSAGENNHFEEYWKEIAVVEGLKNGELIEGAIRINSKNYKEAYIAQENNQDIVIEGIRSRNRALDGDIVVVKILPESEWKQVSKGLQKSGSVVFLRSPIHPRIGVGFLRAMPDGNKKIVSFIPRSHKLPRMRIPVNKCPTDFFLNLKSYESILFLGQMKKWNDVRYATGNIIKMIGNSGNLKAENAAILLENDLITSDLDKNLYSAFLNRNITAEEISKREDLRSQCIFTIDPATARDLDDAVSCKQLENGNFEIGVHISDVTYYIPEDCPLDLIVASRATSVYFVDEVFHMLPRELCFLCSLLPGEDKLAISIFWEITPQGKVLSHRFSRTIVNCCSQLAYEHVQAVLDSPDRYWNESDFPQIFNDIDVEDIIKTIQTLHHLAVIFRNSRFEGGALQIDQIKLKFSIDPVTSMPLSFSTESHEDSHRLIEEFMLLANMTVAHHLKEVFPNIAFLRCHPEPCVPALERLRDTMLQIGLHIDISSAGNLQKSLNRYIGTDVASQARGIVLNHLCAKSMQKALYYCRHYHEKDLDDWHYALNVPLYTHFTSPIRRYADIMVHRLFLASLGCAEKPSWEPFKVKKVADTCNKKKSASKAASEQSIELYLTMYIGMNSPLDVEAVVVDVRDNSFDVISIDLGIVKRIYIDKIPANVKFTNEKSVPSLDVTWTPNKLFRYTTKHVIEIFVIVNIRLTVSESGLKINSALLRPHLSSPNSFHYIEE